MVYILTSCILVTSYDGGSDGKVLVNTYKYYTTRQIRCQ
jgi:hypothetical protein